MKNKTWTILFLDIIVFSIFGVPLVLLNRWQAEINSMPSSELIRYAYASNFTTHTLFLLLAIFIGFGILATTALVSAYYISDRFGWFFLLIFGGLAVFWFGNAFCKVQYRINLPTSEVLAAYVVPESKLKRTDVNRYQLVVPKSAFVNKKTVRSDSGYTQIDGKTFKINGRKIIVNDTNNIVRHHVFGRNQQSIAYTTYSWKKSTPEVVKEFYALNFGELSDLFFVEINE